MPLRGLILALVASAVGCAGTEPEGAPDTGDGARDGSVVDLDGSAAGPDGSGAADALPRDGSGPDGGFRWPVPTSSVALTPSDAWKTRVSSTDPFVHPGALGSFGLAETARWVKFVVLVRDPSRVVFQDSNRYPFHYELINEHLDPFRGRSRQDVERVSLHEQDQELILGAVLFPPREGLAELGIQLEREDAYHPEMVRIVLELVRRGIDTSSTTAAFYVPVPTQRSAARADAAFFEASGFPLADPRRWSAEAGCHAEGWAVGRLVRIPGGEVEAAAADGRLLRDDILLTDEVVGDLPEVAGVLSEAPSTVSSRAAVWARALGVPFASLADPGLRAGARALVGRTVAVRSSAGFGGCDLQILDATAAFTAEQRQELLALKAPAPLAIVAKAARGTIAADTDALGLADARTVGGRAARHGLLRDAAPMASPVAVALSFDLWDAFAGQALTGQPATLGQAIEQRLAPHRTGTDGAALRAALGEVRALIRDQAVFSAEQRTAIAAALVGFDASQPIRFHLSTNAEDPAHPSVLRADEGELGPSRADEAGILRAIQAVYASAFSERAYRERVRGGVDAARLGLGVLAEAEPTAGDVVARGIATVTLGEFSDRLEAVTQAGSRSPRATEDGAFPEVVGLDVFGGTVYPEVRRGSSLARLGDTVLRFREDYEALATLLLGVGERYQGAVGGGERLLELGYRKLRSGALVVTDLRELPSPGPQMRTWPAFLLGESGLRRCTFQGEAGDVFGNHRLKSRWTIGTRSTWLRAPELAGTTFGEVALEVVDDGRIDRTTGALAARPGASWVAETGELLDRWQIPGADARQAELRTTLEREVRVPSSPIRVLGDAYLGFSATWTTPVFDIDFTGAHTTRTTDYTTLGDCPEDRTVDGRNRLNEREAEVSGKRVRTSFYWPQPPGGITAGYTAPLHRWRETVIEGFTAQPIVLRGYWSQTYRPGHHNFSEEFIFEPRLEEGIAPAVVAELEAANVRWIHVTVGEAVPRIAVMGIDGVYRPQ